MTVAAHPIMQPVPTDPTLRSGATWRVEAAPVREPRFDDEQARRHLTLVHASAPTLPFSGQETVVSLMHQRGAGAAADYFDAQPTGREGLPDVERFGRQLFTGLLEVLAGRRAPNQLAPLTSAGIYAGIVRDAMGNDRLGCAGRRPTLQSMRVSEPADGVAELSAVVRVGIRCRAVAARVEGLDGRWRCVRLQIG